MTIFVTQKDKKYVKWNHHALLFRRSNTMGSRRAGLGDGNVCMRLHRPQGSIPLWWLVSCTQAPPPLPAVYDLLSASCLRNDLVLIDPAE